MENVSQTIFEEQSISSMEGKIASVDEIFTLFIYKEREVAERKYLPLPVEKTEGQVYENCNH